MPAQRLVILATANLFIHHSHNLCLAKSKLWSRQTTLALLPCKPSLGHEGGCARRLPVAYPYDLQVPFGVLGGSEVRGCEGTGRVDNATKSGIKWTGTQGANG
jgi:hypothetical protein